MEKPDPKQDGVTHINCWSKGKTDLGQMLSNFAQSPFKHPEFGYFASVEGFWYWLSTGRQHENLRRLYGASAKSVGMQFDIIPMNDEEFQDRVKEAIRCKIEQNKSLLKVFIASELPFHHYYVYGKSADVIVEKPQHQWQMDFLNALRAELRDVQDVRSKVELERNSQILTGEQLSSLF